MIKISNIDEIKPLFEEVYKEVLSDNVPSIEKVCEKEKIFIYKDDYIKGFATVWEDDYFIHFLFIKKSERRKNIATKLIKYLLAYYQKPLTLKCLVNNTGAIAFYKKLGFLEKGKGISEDGEYITLSIEEILNPTL